MKTPYVFLKEYVTSGERHGQAVLDCREHATYIFTEARKQLGLSQRAMAAKLGVHFTYLSKIENLKMYPGHPILEALFRILNEERKG
jgi:ribosome-binding protein aMBF1 (putative translation factor)